MEPFKILNPWFKIDTETIVFKYLSYDETNDIAGRCVADHQGLLSSYWITFGLATVQT